MTIKRRIRKWLDIKDPEEPKDLSKEIAQFKKEQQAASDKLQRDLEFWHRTFKSYSVIPCAHCGKRMHVYPYGGAYYTHNGQKVHAACYDAFLEENK